MLLIKFKVAVGRNWHTRCMMTVGPGRSTRCCYRLLLPRYHAWNASGLLSVCLQCGMSTPELLCSDQPVMEGRWKTFTGGCTASWTMCSSNNSFTIPIPGPTSWSAHLKCNDLPLLTNLKSTTNQISCYFSKSEQCFWFFLWDLW